MTHAPATLPVRNIILTGFMGTGKSTVGRVLAERLNWPLVDTDDIIVERAGKPITRIFAEDGEPAFRDVEARVAHDVAALERHVISTGGGIVLRESNLRALEDAGAVVLLEASPQTIFDRVAHETHRPLLNKPDARAEIGRLLHQRAEAYGRVAIRIATDQLDLEGVVDAVLAAVRAIAPKPDRVEVDLAERSYSILIQDQWLNSLTHEVAKILAEPLSSPLAASQSPPLAAPQPPPLAGRQGGPRQFRTVLLVTNETVEQLWAERVTQAFDHANLEFHRVTIPDGEQHKNIKTLEFVWNALAQMRMNRQGTIIALGGGVVGDLAGFAAATYMRGINYVHLPTTLLAMVDSSVGGKTGFNLASGKNLVGAFWQPSLVAIELDFLRTLPDEELRAGMAEVIKYGMIADAEFFTWLEEILERALERDGEVLRRLVRRCCEIKAEVVSGDEREGGRRAILNFGHTFAHAAEALSDYRVRHGEMVAAGMVAATRLAQARGLVPADVTTRLEGLLRRAGLPTRLPRFKTNEYWDRMQGDKKVAHGRLRLILPEAIGKVAVVDDSAYDEIRSLLETIWA